MKISALSEHLCRLGEGPVWDHETATLYWVDSLAPALHRYEFGNGEVSAWPLPGGSVGSIAPRERGGVVLAMDQGFYAFTPEAGGIELLAAPLEGRDGVRFNDGKVDPFGSFIAGGMNVDGSARENCPLLRLSPDLEVTELLDGFACCNGPCFSADGEKFYVTGRADGVIEVFDYGPQQMPRNGRPLISDCNPDGATVDAEGFVWSAQWSDACVLRIAPDGKVDRRLDVPGEIVTSVMFGGPELDLIYVTTLGIEAYGARPQSATAGRVLVIEDAGVRGRPEPRFKG